MHAHDIILLALKASIMLTLFASALSARLPDLLYLFRHPALLGKALLAMYVIVPVVTIAAVAAFDLHPAVKIALVALAVSPLAPLLPKKQLKAGSDGPYVMGLVAATSLLAVLTMPLSLVIVTHIAGIEQQVPLGAIIKVIVVSLLLPLLAGAAVNHWVPAFAARAARPVAILATVLLIGGCLPLLIKLWPMFVALVGNGTLVAILLFTVVGMAAGHLLGGPDAGARAALALAGMSRHPAMAVMIAHMLYPHEKLAVAAILMTLLIGAINSAPYVAWCKKQRKAAA